jgi:hypothetical protein
MSRRAHWFGRSDDALTLAERALVRAERLTAAQRAMILAIRACALGALGRVQETLRAVGLADEEFSRSDPGRESRSMRFYDARQHAGDTATALAYPAALGHSVVEARTRMQASFDGCTESAGRSKLLSQIKLASLAMTTGDPVGGARLGVDAVRETDRIRSDRVLDLFDALGRHAREHRAVPEVADLLDHLRSATRRTALPAGRGVER